MSLDESLNERSRKILQELYDREASFEESSKLLEEFRIITREKTLDPNILDQQCVESLVNYSVLCHTEAQKSLSNLILNYAHLRNQLINPYVSCVKTRLTDVINDRDNTPLKCKKQLYEVLYYDLRIIFLLSALCSSSRTDIRDHLIDPILKLTGKEADRLSDENYLLVVECLKTLFNLTLDKCINKSLAGDVIRKLFAFVESDMVLSKNKSLLESTDQLLVNLIHLLTNMPEEVYLKLTDENVDEILNHLDNQLKTYSKNRDTILPVLNVCANICKFNDNVRKRWSDQIVGSVKDFDKRPEEYDTLRGRLVKLMTSVDVHLKDLAAEFMHALCGGDTEKFITYTGFGNSVAFLSSRGLLAGNSIEEKRLIDNPDYQEIRDKIDPITGKFDAPKKNPMEGMSEEEKEYHAEELANAITKLANLGVVRPMSVDKEGKLTDLHSSPLDKE